MALMSGWIAADAADGDLRDRAGARDGPRAATEALRLSTIRTRRYSPRLLALFGHYLRRYVRRHFTAVRVARDGVAAADHGPDDPLCQSCRVVGPARAARSSPAQVLPAATRSTRRSMPPRCAAIRCSSASVSSVFGPTTAAGAREFLRASRAVLATGRGIVALTAQGRFSDVRPRPVTIKRGLALLLHELPHARAVPVAIEYPFWNERLPECLIRFGAGVSAGTRDVADVHAALGAALERTLDELAALAIARDAAPFEAVLTGRAGAGWCADLPQRLRARLGRPALRCGARRDRARRRRPLTWPSIVAWIVAVLAALPAALLLANLPLLRGPGVPACTGRRASASRC